MIVVSFCFLVGVTLCHLILLKRNIHGNMLVKWLNRLLLIGGVTTSSGMIILAVNPVGHLNRDGSWALTVFLPHMVGAVVMFTSGIGLMIILATCTTILDYPDWKQRNFFIRCAAAVIGLVSGILMFCVARNSKTNSETPCNAIGYCPVGEMDKLKPLPDRAREYPPGTIVSAICEWIVVLTFLAFSLSFASEFRKFKLCLRLEYRDVDGGTAPLPVKPDASPEKPEARD
uniref:Putative dna damage-regulated autophagy modulator protein 1 n=1 Tax=Ixodes ricinus TaxID=34613 RepID=A0A6B0V4M8_IXORI